MNTLAPSHEALLEASFAPAKQLGKIVDELVAWIKNNPPKTLGAVHRPAVILNLTVANEALKEWTAQTNQKQLT